MGGARLQKAPIDLFFLLSEILRSFPLLVQGPSRPVFTHSVVNGEMMFLLTNLENDDTRETGAGSSSVVKALSRGDGVVGCVEGTEASGQMETRTGTGR